MTRLGWYVHHHGRGHLTRLRAIAPHLDADLHVFSTLPAPDPVPPRCVWTVLDRDDDTRDGRDPAASDPTMGGMLHWAPLGHAGHRGRLAVIAAAVAAEPFDAFVVDVSVEVALLVRLLGVPPILMAQPGVRDDAAHATAFAAARAIVAPWPGRLLRPAHLRPHTARTVYTGGISRFDGRSRPDGGRGAGVVLLGGGGGSRVRQEDVAAAQEATGRAWTILDGGAWVADPWPHLARADVVVSWAGQNAIADLAAAGAPAVVVPQERPFVEQRATAEALDRAGLAAVVPHWPTADAWPALLARAEGLHPRWERWETAGAARRAAEVIARAAA
jgi:hypothetical protein